MERTFVGGLLQRAAGSYQQGAERALAPPVASRRSCFERGACGNRGVRFGTHSHTRRGRGPMRAAVHDRYGPPDVQRIEEVARPVPKADEVLVKIHAATVTRTDTGV